MMKTKHTHQNKFLKIITLPIKALAKARDFYVKSMNNYADKVSYGAGGSVWVGSNYGDAFPRSFSTSSTRSNEKDDFKELVRAASTSTLGNRVDLGTVMSSSSSTRKANTSTTTTTSTLVLPRQKGNGAFNKGVSRSVSVGMAKIEEDKAVDFDEAGQFGETVTNVKQKIRVFPRSMSYGVGGTKKSVAAS